VTYQGDAIVKSEDFTNVDARVVLKESDFRG
jgi:hypothetical protein